MTTTNIHYANVRPGSIISCTSKDNTRYALSSVEVRKHPDQGVFLSATDGRMLAIVHDEKATARKDAPSIMLPRENLPTTISDKFKARCTLQDATWTTFYHSAKKQPIEEPADPTQNFPPAHDIIPDLDDGVERIGVSLDIAKLKAIADAIGRDADDNPDTHLTIWVAKNNKPVVCVGRKGTIGVLSALATQPSDYAKDLAETRAAYRKGLS